MFIIILKSFLTNFSFLFFLIDHGSALPDIVFISLAYEFALFNVKCCKETVHMLHIDIFPSLYYVLFYQILLPRERFDFFRLFFLLPNEAAENVYFFEESNLLFNFRLRVVIYDFEELVFIDDLDGFWFFFLLYLVLASIVVWIVFVAEGHLDHHEATAHVFLLKKFVLQVAQNCQNQLVEKLPFKFEELFEKGCSDA